jgi:hypothetical protein
MEETMSTTQFYRDEILARIPEGLERDVYCQLRDSVGKSHAITLEALTLVVFGEDAKIRIGAGYSTNPTKMRMIREAIETLRERDGVPVCSNSGKAGRYLPESRAELDEFIAEHRSRAKKETEAADKIERAAKNWNFEKPQEHIPASFEAVQVSLFELAGVGA